MQTCMHINNSIICQLQKKLQSCWNTKLICPWWMKQSINLKDRCIWIDIVYGDQTWPAPQAALTNMQGWVIINEVYRCFFFLLTHSAHRVKLWWKSSWIFGRISLPSSGDGREILHTGSNYGGKVPEFSAESLCLCQRMAEYGAPKGTWWKKKFLETFYVRT